MAGKFEVEGVFKATDRMSRVVGKIETRMERWSRKVGGITSQVSQRFSKMAAGASESFSNLKAMAAGPARAVATAALAVGTAAAVGLQKVMSQGMDFEKTLLDAGNKFEPGIKKNSELFKKLSAAAEQVGGSTEFSASQSANALNDLAGAGFTAEQAIAGLPKVVNFATAATLQLSDASEVASKTLSAFGMNSKDPVVLAENLQKVTDVLMKTDAISGTNMPAIFEAMKEGGSVAKSSGASLETFGAMVATLGTAGVEGSSAGTTLKNVFLSLADSTGTAGKALAQLGIKTSDAKGNLRDAIDILAELQKKTAKMGTAKKANVIEGIFGKIPIAGVNIMLDKIDELKQGREELNNSKGQVDLVAASKRQSTQGSWDNLTSGLEAVSLAIFQVVGGPMKSLMDSTTLWIGTFKDQALPFVKAFVAGFRDGFKQAWPVFQQALDIFRSFFGSTGGWIGTVKTLAHYLGDVAAAAAYAGVILGGVLAGAIRLVVWLVEKWIAAWGYILNAAGAAVFAVMDLLSNLAAKWRAFNFADWGMQIVKGIANGIKAGAQWVMDAVGNLADEMINKLKGALDMRSPSRRMSKEVGRPAAAGVGVGWVDEMENVNAQIEKSIEASPMVQPVIAQLPRINALSLGSDMESPELGPQLMSSEERIAGAAAGGDLGHGEIVIRDETGRAEVSEQPKRTKLKIEPARSGQF